MSEPTRPTSVEVRRANDPAGRPCVLLQLEHGYVLLLPDDADLIAQMLVETAAEIRALAAGLDEVPYVVVGNGEEPPWGNDRTCPLCGTPDLPLMDSTPPGLHFISHCGKTWMRGPIDLPY